MTKNIENIIKSVYQQFKAKSKSRPIGNCVGEDDIACFLSGKLLGKELETFNAHILSCKKCAVILKDNAALFTAAKEDLAVPQYLKSAAKALVSEEVGANILDIVLSFKEKAIELIRTTGDILMGPQLVPVPVFRSTGEGENITKEIKVTKTLTNVIAEIGVEKQRPDLANIVVRLTEKETNKKAKEIRVSLMKGDRELQSSLIEDGKVKFEEIKVNDYKIYLTKDEKRIGVINISITTQ